MRRHVCVLLTRRPHSIIVKPILTQVRNFPLYEKFAGGGRGKATAPLRSHLEVSSPPILPPVKRLSSDLCPVTPPASCHPHRDTSDEGKLAVPCPDLAHVQPRHPHVTRPLGATSPPSCLPGPWPAPPPHQPSGRLRHLALLHLFSVLGPQAGTWHRYHVSADAHTQASRPAGAPRTSLRPPASAALPQGLPGSHT